MTSVDARRSAPAVARNRDPILAVLRRVLPAKGCVLEIASGSGEHVVHFAGALPGLFFQPSDPDPAARDSIDAWVASTGVANVRRAITLDATAETWPVASAAAILCINMIHISPWEATLGLIAGAARILPPGGPLVLYGPFKRGGVHTAPSNQAFDEDLRGRNPVWGVRDLEAVAKAAADAGFELGTIVDMPANNLCVCFRKHAAV